MNCLFTQHSRPVRSLSAGNSRHRQFYTHIARATQTATCSVNSTVEAVCLKKFKAHESSLTALLVEEDGPSEPGHEQPTDWQHLVAAIKKPSVLHAYAVSVMLAGCYTMSVLVSLQLTPLTAEGWHDALVSVSYECCTVSRRVW